MNSSVLQRIWAVIKSEGISERKFSEFINILQISLSTLLNRGSEPNVSNDQAIILKHNIDLYNSADYLCNMTGHTIELIYQDGLITLKKLYERKMYIPLGESIRCNCWALYCQTYSLQ